MRISINEARELGKKVLLRPGNLSDEQAESVIDVLIYGDMTGRNTHGLAKLIDTAPPQSLKSEGRVEITKEKGISAHLNGNANAAAYATKKGVDMAIRKCGEYGVGVVGINRIYSSTGAQAYYVHEIAKAGYIGIIASRAPAGVTAHGGKEPVFGTNPIGFGFPTMDDPIIFDMATSAMTWSALIRARLNGESIPGDVALDKNGDPTTDPKEAMEGATLPFDRSYKGAGLAMVVELLGGPLVGASFCDPKVITEKGWGVFILVIDPELFGDKGEYLKGASELRRIILKSDPREKGGKVTIPGERSLENYNRAMKSGEIEIDDSLYGKLQEMI